MKVNKVWGKKLLLRWLNYLFSLTGEAHELLKNVNYYIPKVSRSQIESVDTGERFGKAPTAFTCNTDPAPACLQLNPAWVIMLCAEQGSLCQEAASEGSQGK
jgi:hypothetical protein